MFVTKTDALRSQKNCEKHGTKTEGRNFEFAKSSELHFQQSSNLLENLFFRSRSCESQTLRATVISINFLLLPEFPDMQSFEFSFNFVCSKMACIEFFLMHILINKKFFENYLPVHFWMSKLNTVSSP